MNRAQTSFAALVIVLIGCGPPATSEKIGDGGEFQSASETLSSCPGTGRYCGAELGGAATDNRLYSCRDAGEDATLYQTCSTYCAAASASSYSFCAKTVQMPPSDLSVFANANLYGIEVLWADAVTSGTVTAYGGNRLTDSYKMSQTCPDNADQSCTNAGGQCASFGEFETDAPETSAWAPLTNAQLSVGNAPDGTLLATFVNRVYTPGHAMFKCGAYFCDANFCPTCVATPDNIVRRHAAPSDPPLSSFSVVAVPGN